MRRRAAVAEAVSIVPITEAERIRRQAEVFSSLGSAAFAGAKQRLALRRSVPGLGGLGGTADDDDEVLGRAASQSRQSRGGETGSCIAVARTAAGPEHRRLEGRLL